MTLVEMPAGLRGSLGWFHLADVLQLVCLSRHPSKITVIRGNELVASIHVVGDLVVSAVAGGLTGDQAFFKAFSVDAGGRFEVRRVDEMPGTSPMGTVTSLILDHSDKLMGLLAKMNGLAPGSGRVPPGEVFLEGQLGEFPLEDVLPSLAHPERLCQMDFYLSNHRIGMVTMVGTNIGHCSYYQRSGVEAFEGLFSEAPRATSFVVGRLPEGSLAGAELIGPANQVLMDAVVLRDEVAHGHTPAKGTRRGDILGATVIELPWNPEDFLLGSPEAVEANFRMAAHYLVQERYDEAEVLLQFCLSIEPGMERARRALEQAWERRFRHAIMSPAMRDEAVPLT